LKNASVGLDALKTGLNVASHFIPQMDSYCKQFFSFVSAYHIIFKRFKNMMAALIPEESCFFVIVVFLKKSSAP